MILDLALSLAQCQGMPLIQLHIPALEAEARSRLVDALSTSLLRWREAPDSARSRRNVWTFVQHYAEGEVLDGTQLPTAERRCLARVAVAEGGLDDRRKAGLVREFTRTLVEVFGESLRVWVVIEEVAEGNWGADGQITRFADTQRILGAQA